MRWTRLEIRTEPAAMEPVAAALFEAGCAGTEQAPQGIAGYLPVDDTLEGRLHSLRETLDRLPSLLQTQPAEIVLSFVEEEDWAEAWKAHFKPMKIGERLVVAPSWSDYTAESGQVVVELDPGMAFGTGAHPTTQLCLKALERTVTGGETVVDWGTGSGLLAIAAAKLGAAGVWAGDIDPLAVSVAEENVRRNGVEERVRLIVGERPTCFDVQADVTVCNILAGIILDLAGDLNRVTRPGGTLIASGIIDTRGDEVKAGLEKNGFQVTEVETQGEWVAIYAVRI
ncbi:MAG: 50S ribosomal protein L11 methyltransferase [Armatimonadetes bacterium]|nr:50S ribosomal protein L11 methyltransferase [Armatimonadota bacterium]